MRNSTTRTVHEGSRSPLRPFSLSTLSYRVREYPWLTGQPVSRPLPSWSGGLAPTRALPLAACVLSPRSTDNGFLDPFFISVYNPQDRAPLANVSMTMSPDIRCALAFCVCLLVCPQGVFTCMIQIFCHPYAPVIFCFPIPKSDSLAGPSFSSPKTVPLTPLIHFRPEPPGIVTSSPKGGCPAKPKSRT